MHSDSYLARFAGIARLYGSQALAQFSRSHVAIIGVGGVGCWVAEALARSGIGAITLVDLDDLCVTNTNRQLHATCETIGQSKATVMAQRLRSINPEIRVEIHQEFFTEKNAAALLAPSYHWVVDAIDAVRPKCLLLALCHQRKIPVITSGGAGGRIRTDCIERADLARSHGCALLLQVRKNLRLQYGFPEGGPKSKRFGIPAVFSSEAPRYPTVEGCVTTERPADLGPGLRCDAGYGTSTPLVGTFGFAIAGAILENLASLAEIQYSLPPADETTST